MSFIKRRIEATKEWFSYNFHDWTWGLTFEIILVVLFLITIIGNGLAGSMDGGPYP